MPRRQRTLRGRRGINTVLSRRCRVSAMYKRGARFRGGRGYKHRHARRHCTKSYLSHVSAGICEHLIRKVGCIRARRLCWRRVCRSHRGALLAMRFLLHMAEASGSEKACEIGVPGPWGAFPVTAPPRRPSCHLLVGRAGRWSRAPAWKATHTRLRGPPSHSLSFFAPLIFHPSALRHSTRTGGCPSAFS